MKRCSRLIDPERAVQVTYTDLAVCEQIQQTQARRIGQHSEQYLRLRSRALLHSNTYMPIHICFNRKLAEIWGQIVGTFVNDGNARGLQLAAFSCISFG